MSDETVLGLLLTAMAVGFLLGRLAGWVAKPSPLTLPRVRARLRRVPED